MKSGLKLALGGLFVGLFLAAPASASIVLIDSFTDPLGNQTAQTAGNTTAVFSGVTSTSAIGGTRELYAQNRLFTGGGNGANVNNRYATSAGFGTAGFGDASTQTRATGALVWDGVANSSGAANGTTGFGRGLTATDLTGGGTNTVFRFGDLSVVGTMTMWVNLNIGLASGFATSGPIQISALPGGDFDILLSSFLLSGGATDLTNVTGIQVYFDNRATCIGQPAGCNSNPANAAGSKVNFAFIQASPVPEPATLLLMGGSLLGLAYFRKRRPN